MADLSGLTTNFFPTPKEGFTTTTSGSIDSSTDTTIGLNSVSGLTNGNVFTGLIDPGNAKERAFTGVVDTSGSQITNVVFTTGSNATHTAGATVVDYVTSTHIAQITKGILQEHNPDGTHLAGTVEQVVYTMSSAVATGSTGIPLDDTIPQNTEGDEYMTLAITPKSATNILVIEVNAYVSDSGVSSQIIGALFQDSTANALSASSVYSEVANERKALTIKHVMVAGTTSATTFKFRAGQFSGTTVTFNGSGGSRLFGAIPKSSMVITEYRA